MMFFKNRTVGQFLVRRKSHNLQEIANTNSPEALCCRLPGRENRVSNAGKMGFQVSHAAA
jgi:hypothetical protein